LLLLLPASSIQIEYASCAQHYAARTVNGNGCVFWSAGVRLLLAGLRQLFQPRFTSEQIFGIQSDDVLPLVRGLGVSNFATGVVGISSLAKPSFVLV
jgi:hypothetical protein